MAARESDLSELFELSELSELSTAVATIRQVFGAAACSCALVIGDDRLTFAVADGIGADLIVGTTIPLGKGIAGFAVLSGEAIAVADVERDPRFARDIAESTDYVPNTILAAPLLDPDGDPIGVIEVLDPRSRGSDTGRDLAVLGALASQVATILRLTRASHTATTATITTGPSTPTVADGGAETVLTARILGAVRDYLDQAR